MIRNSMETSSYPFKSYIDLFNNNVVRISGGALGFPIL